MKANNGYGSFFNSLDANNTSTHSLQPQRAHAVALIQRWWKQLHMRHTVIQSFDYMHEIISLHYAQEHSYEHLQEFILNPKRIEQTHSLLLHLERMKDQYIPQRVPLTYQDLERPFLAAYLIATKFDSFLDSSCSADLLLHKQALAMIHSFEQLSVAIKESTSPIKKNQFQETSIGQYIATCHSQQLNFYYSFYEWKNNSKEKPASVYLAYYLQLELKRLSILNGLDARLLDFYDTSIKKQEQLKNKIRTLLGTNGLEHLAQRVAEVRELFEIHKWTKASTEQLTHELMLNPSFSFHPKTFLVQPKISIDSALTALPDTNSLLSVFAELIEKIRLLTPYNPNIIAQLYTNLNKISLNTLNVYEGGMQICMHLIETILYIEEPGHNAATLAVLEQKITPNNTPTGYKIAFKHAIELLYSKIAQINLAQNNTLMKQSHALVSQQIIPFEQKKFAEYLVTNQLTQQVTLEWMDKLVTQPSAHRLSVATLCSQYSGSYITHALILELLKQPRPILRKIPETFYLDTVRLLALHEQYHHVVHAAAILSYLESFCQKYNITLSSTKLKQQKDLIIKILDDEHYSTVDERSHLFVMMLEKILKVHERTLSSLDRNTFIHLLDEIEQGTNKVAKIFNSRLNNMLGFYFTRGGLPTTQYSSLHHYGFTQEITHLMQPLMPIIRLHSQVYGPLYQRHIEQRLWMPLFSLFKNNVLSKELPVLFSTQEEGVHALYQRIHNLALVVSGLTLIKQTLNSSDAWQIHNELSNPQLKHHANTLKLVNAIQSPLHIKKQLQHLMHDIAEQQEVAFDEKQFNKILHSVQTKHAHSYKATIDELVSHLKSTIISSKHKKIHHSSLLAEFSGEIKAMEMQLKNVINDIKKDQLCEDHDPNAQTHPAIMRAGRR